uniref:Putative secreted protein n=1 Tax=Rhipicephalus microplus TaxID=6941 RepID=A0A6G5A1Q8_RHIMP
MSFRKLCIGLEILKWLVCDVSAGTPGALCSHFSYWRIVCFRQALCRTKNLTRVNLGMQQMFSSTIMHLF